MITELKEEKSTDQYALKTVYLYFSGYCNLKCRHCWIDPKFSTDKNPKSDEVDIKAIISALDECRQLGMSSIKVTGGEPFLRNDIFELLDYCKDRKLNVSFETNATLIGEKEAKALKDANVYHIAVSLDGPNGHIHQLLRGIKGSFDKAVEGIKFLKSQNLNVQVIISLWRKNKDYIKPTIDFVRKLGVNSVKINIINCIARADDLVEEKEVLSVKEIIDFYNELMKELEKEPPFSICFDIPPAFHPIVNGRLKHLSVCGIFGILGILADGRISICGIGNSLDTIVFGRIGRDSIKEIWQNHPTLKEIRQGVPHNLKGVCGKCMLRYYCLGKCRAEAFYTDGSLLAPLSFCQQAYEQGLFPASRLQTEVETEKYIQRNNSIVSYRDNGSLIISIWDGKDYIKLEDFSLWLWNRLGEQEKIFLSQLKTEVQKSGIMEDVNALEAKIDELVKKNIFLYSEQNKNIENKTNFDSKKLNKYRSMYNSFIRELNSSKKFGKVEDLYKYHKNSIHSTDRHFETKEITVSYLYRESNAALKDLSYGERLFEEINKLKKIQKNTKILDVGAGIGTSSSAFLKALQKNNPQVAGKIDYLFCDLTFKFLESQRNLTKAYPTEFVQANAETLSFKDNSFDIIIANENIADFSAVKLSKKTVLDFLEGKITKEQIQDESTKKSLEWIKSCSIDVSDALPEFIFNLGAFEFIKEIKRLLKPNGLAFVCEAGFWKGYPWAMPVFGHIEYSIQFSQLMKCIKSLGMNVDVHTLLDFLVVDKEKEIIDAASLYFLYNILKRHNIDLPYLAYTREVLKEKVPENLLNNFRNLRFKKIMEESVCHNLNKFYVLLIKKGENDGREG